MRRAIISWSVVGVLVIAAFGATVVGLNSSLYSASGFVRGYLDALARHDATGALELTGTIAAGDASLALLDESAMGDLDDISLVSDVAGADGLHSVVYSWTADGEAGTSTFRVQRAGSVLGLFDSWAFAESPLGILQVSVANSSEFTANGIDLATSRPGTTAPYLVFTPGAYEFTHDSLYLHSDPMVVTSSQPGAAVIAPVVVEPTDAFVEQVQREINDFLDGCVTQEVLLPTGCPFGQEISNRVDSTPDWSIVEYPRVTLEPGPDPASWLMPETDAAAHLDVDIKSIFDGSVSRLDEDVPFTSSYLVTFLPGDELLITEQHD